MCAPTRAAGPQDRVPVRGSVSARPLGSGGKRITTRPPVASRCSASLARLLAGRMWDPSDMVMVVWTPMLSFGSGRNEK